MKTYSVIVQAVVRRTISVEAESTLDAHQKARDETTNLLGADDVEVVYLEEND